MGKTFYHKPWETYCRRVKINGVVSFVCSNDKEYLDSLPYRIKTKESSNT